MQSASKGVGYIETGNHCTFLAEALAGWLPLAAFLHIVREPRAVIRSGVVRKWYVAMAKYDRTRIRPLAGSAEDRAWEGWSQMQKIAWLWAATNRYILDFTKRYPGRVLLVRAEDLFDMDSGVYETLFAFLDLASLPTEVVHAVLRQQINRQHGLERFPASEAWTPKMNAQLLARAEPEMAELGYE